MVFTECMCECVLWLKYSFEEVGGALKSIGNTNRIKVAIVCNMNELLQWNGWANVIGTILRICEQVVRFNGQEWTRQKKREIENESVLTVNDVHL